jgi:hypothetical protein
VRRDSRRGNRKASTAAYKTKIPRAVEESRGIDAYTGETLDWRKISKYKNKDSKRGGRRYKKRFALLPTVDHLGDGTANADFVICAWRTNDAKSDLTRKEFLKLCRKVVAFAARRPRR